MESVDRNNELGSEILPAHAFKNDFFNLGKYIDKLDSKDFNVAVYLGNWCCKKVKPGDTC